MRMSIRIVLSVALLLLSLPHYINGQSYKGKVSVNATHQVHKNGQLFTVQSTTLYDGSTGAITCHYTSPSEFYKTINTKGETTIYVPEKNEVSFTQNSQYGSDSELLYYFVNNFTQHLGLESEGFIRNGARTEGNYYITTWQAPAGLKPVHTVELVFENFLPVYAEYQGLSGKPLKKIYYYEYHHANHFSLPRKITEIAYTSERDSTVRRTTFSDIQTGMTIEDSRFNFQIPDDAVKLDL
ncbi:MAG: outer membrane lipoprotein-sorting protein [Bacteroidales bacterium]|nr:outer membrane lipoprotein-sorting protein [Bacteroidales bacterium]